MSMIDTMTSLVSAPWFDTDCNPLSVRALPGLRPAVIQSLEYSHLGMTNCINALPRERPCDRTLLWAFGPVPPCCGVIPMPWRAA
jgi:hypothetical protein